MRPIEKEINPDKILEEVKHLSIGDITDVLERLDFEEIEELVRDNPFILDVVERTDEKDILEFCREELGIEDREECFGDEDNILEYIMDAYGDIEGLLKYNPEVQRKIMDAYRAYMAGEVLARKLYDLMEEGKFDPDNPKDVEALKKLIERFPFSEEERENLKDYVFEDLGII